MFVSMTDVMVVSVIPPDESGGYRMTDETVQNRCCPNGHQPTRQVW